jgi:hypothetical protein
MKALRGVLVTFWIIPGLYVGVAGWTTASRLPAILGVTTDGSGSSNSYFEYDGLSFRDRESLTAFLRDQRFAGLFSWTFDLPSQILALLTSLAWGIAGGATRLVKNLSFDNAAISDLPVFLGPVFGGLLGLMVWLMSLLAPALLVTGETTARPETLVVLSFFGGMFSEDAYEWVRKRVRKMFKP